MLKKTPGISPIDAVLRFYANPKSWMAKVPTPGPYSTGTKSELSDDNGRVAREYLRSAGTLGDFILIMMDLMSVNREDLLHKTDITEVRFKEILADRVTISSEERRALATAFSIGPDEL